MSTPPLPKCPVCDGPAYLRPASSDGEFEEMIWCHDNPSCSMHGEALSPAAWLALPRRCEGAEKLVEDFESAINFTRACHPAKYIDAVDAKVAARAAVLACMVTTPTEPHPPKIAVDDLLAACDAVGVSAGRVRALAGFVGGVIPQRILDHGKELAASMAVPPSGDGDKGDLAREKRVVCIDPDYRVEPKTDLFCCRCQKDMKPEQATNGVHLVDGAWEMAIHPRDAGAKDVVHPIGSDCAKKLPPELIVGFVVAKSPAAPIKHVVSTRNIPRTHVNKPDMFEPCCTCGWRGSISSEHVAKHRAERHRVFPEGDTLPKSPAAPLPPVPPEDADALIDALVRDVTVQVMRETMSAYVDGILPPKDSPESPSVAKSKAAIRALILPAPALDVDALLLMIKAKDLEKNNAYSERNKVAVALAHLARLLGYNAVQTRHKDDGRPWDEDWKNVVLIDLPCGQVTWHIQDAEANLLAGLPVAKSNEWDGHSTEEKYRRLATLAQLPSPVVPPESQDVEALCDVIRDCFNKAENAWRNRVSEPTRWSELAIESVRSALSRPTGGAK